MPAKIVLDANVLYSARLRDLWMELGVAGLVHPVWTDRIEFETRWGTDRLLDLCNLRIDVVRRPHTAPRQKPRIVRGSLSKNLFINRRLVVEAGFGELVSALRRFPDER